ncbi:hypothetical protein [Roseisolibacter sp. H3M3-2]|uniref:DUF4345 family protein n=1 Tax=Roseisolibacter sp. H3M3-2 TaxID=3031323 RepID=UPI0023DB8809|nr:hypothetical protein [Roseisolibacter sp. H3M3-2]
MRPAPAPDRVGRPTRALLLLSAVHATYVGAAMLLAPGRYYAPTGLAMTPPVGMVVRAQGATWLGLGVVAWLARRGERRQAVTALAGHLVVQSAAAAVAVQGRAHLPRPALLVDLGGHALLALAFGTALAVALARRPAPG